jgi:hypothetical protein
VCGLRVCSRRGPQDPNNAEEAWIAEIDRRARNVAVNPDGGGDDCSAARGEIESKLGRS